MKKKIKIFDTTLRDGNQAKGISFSTQDKLIIAEMLDEFGVDYIEGGWPNATNKADVEFFKKCRNRKWKHARISVFGSTRRPSTKVKEDSGLRALVAAGTDVITIFGKSWDLHVKQVLRTSLRRNLEMIRESVAFLKDHCDEVIYDAEHFFDGYRENTEYAMKTLEAAAAGGADCLVLCDTNGGVCLPWEMEAITQSVKNSMKCEIGIHPHNDTGTAIANVLAAVRGGATHVQGTINGYGERCGNANLTVLIANLQLKMGIPMVSPSKLETLRNLSTSLDELANMAPDIRQPYVGEAAFAHKGGAHIDGIRKERRSFEHINPAVVGNTRDFIVSNQSGAGLVLDKIKKIKPGIDKTDPKVQDILVRIKQMEGNGFHFEVADGSFQLMVRRSLGMVKKEKFRVLGYRVIEESRHNREAYSEATVKLDVQGRVMHMAAEGNGPVDAMAKAVRRSLEPAFPQLRNVRLQDFKVRVLEGSGSTAATVRVWIRFQESGREGDNSWNTMGVSGNIIEASWMALLDGFNYKLLVK